MVTLATVMTLSFATMFFTADVDPRIKWACFGVLVATGFAIAIRLSL